LKYAGPYLDVMRDGFRIMALRDAKGVRLT
jgi:hypothetical protein